MGGTIRDQARLKTVVSTSVAVVAYGGLAAMLAFALVHFLLEGSATGLARWTLLLLAAASGLFVAAGVLRLARWRLVHDAHSALVGSALLVMGGLCLPLVGVARLFGSSPQSAAFIGASTRCVGSFVAMALILRALRSPETTRSPSPARLLRRLFLVVTSFFLVVLTVASLSPGVSNSIFVQPRILAALLTTGWLWVAFRVGMRSGEVAWAGRAAPLYVGMAVAETLCGLGLGPIDSDTFAGVLVGASVAALSARAALMDLDRAVMEDEAELSSLSAALDQKSGEAETLAVWREQLTHDARNAVAGLRAAMSILSDTRTDPGAADRLRSAAAQEITHLEHLLTRSSAQRCSSFDAGEVVRQVGDCARALGGPVRVHAPAALATGRAEDLAAVVKHLLINAATHAPGSNVEIRVTTGADRVTVTYRDDGPGLRQVDPARVFDRGCRGAASAGSGLGLYAARELMREQGGDLVLGEGGPGASFVLTLPSAVKAPAGQVQPIRLPVRVPVRVPAQRSTDVDADPRPTPIPLSVH